MIRRSFALIGSNVKGIPVCRTRFRGVIRHRLKLSFASRAKPIHITNQPLATRQASAKDLID
jgi:hypothetical protein